MFLWGQRSVLFWLHLSVRSSPSLKLHRKTRCIFQMALTDESGSATAVISRNVAEQLLGATADDTIFQTTCIKVQRATFKGSNGGQRTIRILVYIEKERFFPIIGGAKHNRVVQSDVPIDTSLKQPTAKVETSGSSVAGDVVTAVEMV